MRTMPRRVLIVDDHATFRNTARAVARRAGFDVVAEASGVAEALATFAAVEVDAVLLDVLLPDGDGFEVAHLLAQADRPPVVVLISTREAASFGDRVARAPVHGFIGKRDLTPAALAALLG